MHGGQKTDRFLSFWLTFNKHCTTLLVPKKLTISLHIFGVVKSVSLIDSLFSWSKPKRVLPIAVFQPMLMK